MIKQIYYRNKLSLFIYEENILSSKKYQELLIFLEAQKYKGGKCISGKPIPRLQIWYHQDKSFFCEKWKYRYDRWKSEEYHPILKEVQAEIQDKTQKILESLQESSQLPREVNFPQFNSCLVNKYRNGQDSIKPHQDSSDSFGEYPTISNLSMLSSREIVVSPLSKLKGMATEKIKIQLQPNSLFIMAGASQKYFTHSIPKEETDQERYSLTFRQHYQIPSKNKD